jgi:hypothetical protein
MSEVVKDFGVSEVVKEVEGSGIEISFKEGIESGDGSGEVIEGEGVIAGLEEMASVDSCSSTELGLFPKKKKSWC